MSQFSLNSLVLYKSKPAKITDIGEKITIEFAKKKTKKVREKDIYFLHPEFNGAADKIDIIDIDVTEAWELLEGETVDLSELASLLFDQPTAQQIWSIWQAVTNGLYFEGTVDAIIPRDKATIEAESQKLAEKVEKEKKWQDFLERLKNATLDEADRKALADVEQLALKQTDKSRILYALNLDQTPASAHKMLIKWGYWDATHNPCPQRFNINLKNPDLAIPTLPSESREDLTHLTAYAIDDDNSNDPDDAIGLDPKGKFWVHIADVAALVTPQSELDIEAQTRGANLYLPEKVIHMLPTAMTDQLGLGLQETSPALSVGFDFSETGEPINIEIKLTHIKVTRTTYNQVESEINEAHFQALKQPLDLFEQWRINQGATNLELPDVQVSVQDGKVQIEQQPALQSRDLVANAMVAAGYAVAKFTQEHDIPLLYASQQPPEEIQHPTTLSGHYGYRRFFKPSKVQTVAEPHFGLGLPVYTRVTSPLRRYSDLIVHQQLRAFIYQQPLQTAQEITERMAVANNEGFNLRRAERFSNTHWKLIYLQQHKNWQAEAVVVQLDERKMTIMIPEIAYESKLRLDPTLKLDDKIQVKIKNVDISEAEAYFQII